MPDLLLIWLLSSASCLEKIHNRGRPDGSIVQAYLTEECVSFCNNYIDDDQSFGLPTRKHVDRLEGVGHSQLKRDLNVDIQNRQDDFDKTRTVVLQQADIITPWQQTYKDTLKREHAMARRQRTGAQIFRELNSKFAAWLKERIREKPVLPMQISSMH